MTKMSIREAGEAIALLGVIASLLFVGLELRNNGRAARATAYQEIGLAAADSWFMKAADRELNDLVELANADDPTGWDRVNQSDRQLVRSYVLGVLRLYETVFLQVDERLLPSDAMESLGWFGFEDTNLLRRTWPDLRGSVTPRFAEYLETQAPELRSR